MRTTKFSAKPGLDVPKSHCLACLPPRHCSAGHTPYLLATLSAAKQCALMSLSKPIPLRAAACRGIRWPGICTFYKGCGQGRFFLIARGLHRFILWLCVCLTSFTFTITHLVIEQVAMKLILVGWILYLLRLSRLIGGMSFKSNLPLRSGGRRTSPMTVEVNTTTASRCTSPKAGSVI